LPANPLFGEAAGVFCHAATTGLGCDRVGLARWLLFPAHRTFYRLFAATWLSQAVPVALLAMPSPDCSAERPGHANCLILLACPTASVLHPGHSVGGDKTAGLGAILISTLLAALRCGDSGVCLKLSLAFITLIITLFSGYYPF